MSINRIVILGGGSAGWLTAARLAAKFKAPGALSAEAPVSITLIESPEVGIIGVGEGSWPSLRLTLSEIGVSEKHFMSQCQASFKQGSKFVGWQNGDPSEYYYHPFSTPSGYTEINLQQQWQSQFADTPYAYAFAPQAAVCDAGLAPKQASTPDFAQVANYGYHFDADKLAAFLCQHCVQQLGVVHIRDHIDAVQSHANGDIKALVGKSSGPIAGDFFIDCSGMAARLLTQHYGIPWRSVKHILPTDSAVAAQVPYPEPQSPIASTTIATAQDYGWTWEIGLQHRKGMGFAYASEHYDPDQAQTHLLAHLRRNGVANPEDLALRNLRFNPGYREKFWHNNCLAIGMTSGFIEPLEASSLAMTELSINMLCDEFPRSREHMQILAQRFNQRFQYRWQRVIDFIKLHYVLSQRNDTPYWQSQRASSSIPDTLQHLLELWQYQPPSRLDFIENEEVFSSASYQFVLYGMGFTTALNPETTWHPDRPKAAALFQQNQQQQSRYLQGLPSNRELLNSYHS